MMECSGISLTRQRLYSPADPGGTQSLAFRARIGSAPSDRYALQGGSRCRRARPFRRSHHCHQMRTTRSETEGLPAVAGPVVSSLKSSAPIAKAAAPCPVAVPVVETLGLGAVASTTSTQ